MTYASLKDLQSSALPLGDRALKNEIRQVEAGSAGDQVKIHLLPSFTILILYRSIL